MYDTNFLNLH